MTSLLVRDFFLRGNKFSLTEEMLAGNGMQTFRCRGGTLWMMAYKRSPEVNNTLGLLLAMKGVMHITVYDIQYMGRKFTQSGWSSKI